LRVVLGSGVALLPFRNIETIPKQPLQIAKRMQRPRFTGFNACCSLHKHKKQCDAAYWRLTEKLRNRWKQLLTQKIKI